MPVFGSSKNTDYFSIDKFDMNSFTPSQSFFMGSSMTVGVFIIAKTGTHATHAIKIEGSPDDVNWFDTGIVVARDGCSNGVAIMANYLRVIATTLEGSSSTCDIKIIVK